MKNTLRSVITICALALISILLVSRAEAQPNPGPGNQGSSTGTTNDGPTVPFDGGMSLILLASGISYSAKKLKKR